MKIAIFKIGAIGDSLLSTPFIRQLRLNYPNAIIDYIIGRTAAPTLKNNENLNDVVCFDETLFFRKDLFSWIKLINMIRKRHYDSIFVLDKHKGCILTVYLTGIKKRVGFDRMGKEGSLLTHSAYYANDKHEIYYYLDLLKASGIKPDYSDISMELSIDAAAMKYAKSFWKKNLLAKKSVIALSPGGGNNPGESTGIRNWSVNNYASLADKLIEQGYTVILIGGKSDIITGKKLLSLMTYKNNEKNKNKEKIHSLIGRLSLHESAAIMSLCDCVVCNDSGPMHIAAAVNRHVISIFGPTNPDRKAPLWKESKSLWNGRKEYFPDYELYGKMPPKCSIDSINKITADDVLNAVKAIMDV